MPKPSYRALSILLRAFSVVAAPGGPPLIFAEKPLIVRILLHPPEAEASTLLLSLLNKMGGIVLMLSALQWLASRNPVRSVAAVDALIAGLCTLALTPLQVQTTLVIDPSQQLLRGLTSAFDSCFVTRLQRL